MPQRSPSGDKRFHKRFQEPFTKKKVPGTFSQRAGPLSCCDGCLRRSRLISLLAGHIDSALGQGKSVAALFSLTDSELVEAIAGSGKAGILRKLDAVDIEREHSSALQSGLWTVCQHSPSYPARFKGLVDRPACLFVCGSEEQWQALQGPSVAIVGARRASPYGLEVARELARELALAGVAIVSGMAFGVDSAAHQGALDAKGVTVAVLGCGADIAYPVSKLSLYRSIVTSGLVISEFPPGFRPRKWTFPARNRIMAALGDMTVVVEAGRRSGSLITAGFASELGRPVGAVPGPITAAQSQGTNGLICDGARPVTCAGDVLEEILGVDIRSCSNGGEAKANAMLSGLSTELKRVLDAVGRGHDTVDKLTAVVNDAGRALSSLGELELLGLIGRAFDGRYMVRGGQGALSSHNEQ